jgi:hypothetical protein
MTKDTDKTTQFINMLRAITPDRNYSACSKELILKTPPFEKPTLKIFTTRAIEALRFASALMLASFLALLIIGGLPYLKSTLPLRMAGLDTNVIQAEEREIQITLEQLSYYENSTQKVRAALRESAQQGPGQLSRILLEEEAGKTKLEEPLQNSIDDALRALVE